MAEPLVEQVEGGRVLGSKLGVHSRRASLKGVAPLTMRRLF